jgi:predicted nucleotidyltransferase
MTSKEFILNTIRAHRLELGKYGIQNVGLFGSYSTGKSTQLSDIDILIDFVPEEESFDNYMAVCDYLEKLFKNEKVEIVTMNGLSPYIRPQILKEVVYV